MVTGKNKEQFEKWFKKSSMYEEYIFLTQIDVSFNDLPFEMQIGVYLAYYDHKEILINAMSYERSRYWIGNVNHNITSKKHTRNEAYKAAFKKADELINQNKE